MEPSVTEPNATNDAWWRRLGRRLRFQFTIRGLLVLTFATAVGLSVVKAEGESRRNPDLFFSEWGHGVLAAVAACFVLGLVNQVRDLWATYRGRADLDPEEHWGWRFAAAWRVAVAVLLVVCYVVEQLQVRKLITWPDELVMVGLVSISSIPVILFDLVLFTVVLSIPVPPRRKSPSIWNRVISVASVVVGVLFCIFFFWQGQLLTYLVHVAVTKMELAEPLDSPSTALVNGLVHSEHTFLTYSIAGGIACLICVAILRQMSHLWLRGRAQRSVWCGLFLAAVLGSAVYPVWIYTNGLGRVAPFMRAELPSWPLKIWIVGGMILCLGVSIGAARLIAPTYEREEDRRPIGIPDWRRRPNWYYHERPIVLIPLFALPIANAIQFIYLVFQRRLPGMWGSPWEYIETAFSAIQIYITAALALLALGRFICAAWRRQPIPTLTPRLNIGQFCAVWLGLLCATITGATTLCWLSFGLYFGTWWHRLAELVAK